MNRKFLIVLLIYALLIMTATVTTFAESKNQKQIKTTDQLKEAMASAMEDGTLSVSEKKELLANSEEAAVAELIEEKMDAAANLLNGVEVTVDMKTFPDGSAYASNQYDLGDGCRLVVELQDRAEIVGNNMSSVLAATAGSSEQWKGYGYRYFTARASVKCNIGTAYLNLENHYTLSANGIDERPGKAGSNSDNSKILIAHGAPKITDSTARTPGGSDVNMHCGYTVQALSASGTQSQKSTYRLQTTVKYLALDKAGKRIRVGQTWGLTKKS